MIALSAAIAAVFYLAAPVQMSKQRPQLIVCPLADPGEKFPWRLLHDSGIGLWVKPIPVTAAGGRIFVLGDADPEVQTLQTSLRHLGYGIETTGSYDSETMAVVAAFQRHHRPAKVDGIADVSTVATLGALLTAREPRVNGASPSGTSTKGAPIAATLVKGAA